MLRRGFTNWKADSVPKNWIAVNWESKIGF